MAIETTTITLPATTDGGHELALTIINDGAGYQRRKNAGKRMIHTAPISASVTQVTAGEWCDIAREGARQYEKQSPAPWSDHSLQGRASGQSDACGGSAMLALLPKRRKSAIHLVFP